MDTFHFKNHATITQSILGFAGYVRSRDFNVGIRETQEALRVASLGLVMDKDFFKYSLKAIFCSTRDQALLFDELFSDYWDDPKYFVKHRVSVHGLEHREKKVQRSLVMLGKGESKEEGEEGKNVSGANWTEQLRKTDFANLSDMDSAFLEKIANALWREMSCRLKKKMNNSRRKGRLDIRRTIRNNISHGGAMLDLKFRYRVPEKNKLVVLLDVSGSMDKYSFYLLRFILALRNHFKKVEVFIFSTKLVRVTDYVSIRDMEEVLSALANHADHWSGGTRIGECLQAFNRVYAKRILNGRSMTLVLSDGLDTGEPGQLSEELHKVKLRTRRLIWLNPLKGMKDYQPLARGMKEALPEIDVFRSAHSLDSLLELENYLTDV